VLDDVACRGRRISLHNQALEGREAGERERGHDQQSESRDGRGSAERSPGSCATSSRRGVDGESSDDQQERKDQLEQSAGGKEEHPPAGVEIREAEKGGRDAHEQRDIAEHAQHRHLPGHQSRHIEQVREDDAADGRERIDQQVVVLECPPGRQHEGAEDHDRRALEDPEREIGAGQSEVVGPQQRQHGEADAGDGKAAVHLQQDTGEQRPGRRAVPGEVRADERAADCERGRRGEEEHPDQHGGPPVRPSRFLAHRRALGELPGACRARRLQPCLCHGALSGR
jgi:hypothetical protein